MGRYERPRQHRDCHKDTVFDELELYPAGLNVQVVEDLCGSGPAGDVVHDWGEKHNLLAVAGGAEEKHGRSDADCHITIRITYWRVTVNLSKLGIDQVIEMLLVAGHCRLNVGPFQV